MKERLQEIRINCKGADALPIGDLKDFQGDLKTISNDNLEKLKRSIKKHGFAAPVFVWDNGGVNNILDGHQRLKALIDLQGEGYRVPELPVVYIYADNEKDAKEKLLYITSQYGEFEAEGLQQFTSNIDFDFSDIRLTFEEFEFYTEADAETDFPDLREGDKEPFQQMTFTLADEQAMIVKDAVNKALGIGCESELNANKNGNALAMICGVFIGQC